jgi:UV DNA damage repair endonuclease
MLTFSLKYSIFITMTFSNNIQRIGFACKWAEINKKGEIASTEGLNTGGTTLAWARRNKRNLVEEKIMDVAKKNILNTHALIKKVAELPSELRMLRITSDMLSFYTHEEYTDFWQSTEVQNSLARWFAPLGETARANDVRLSFHPDQFVVLASDRPEVVNKSIEEFEYHVDMARWMGYGRKYQDLKINVHISGRKGPAGIKDALRRLTPEARNCITIENDEISWGIESSIELCNDLALVLDIHHHWVMTGEYIRPDDDRIKRIIDSWRGVRPVIHFSTSREDGIIERNTTEPHNLQSLLESGYNKQKLRAHSDYFYNDAMNRWAHGHWSWADIMCESKAKNLASMKLYDTYKTYA